MVWDLNRKLEIMALIEKKSGISWNWSGQKLLWRWSESQLVKARLDQWDHMDRKISAQQKKNPTKGMVHRLDQCVLPIHNALISNCKEKSTKSGIKTEEC